MRFEIEEIIKNQQDINFYFVFQNKTYFEEKKLSILWAPVDAIPHHITVGKVKKGDVILHGYKKQIVAFSIAQQDAIQSPKPKGFIDTWGENGYLVKTKYYFFTKPVTYDKIDDAFLNCQPQYLRPFHKNKHNIVNGNQGYLFHANYNMFQSLLTNTELLEYLEQAQDEELFNKLNTIAFKTVTNFEYNNDPKPKNTSSKKTYTPHQRDYLVSKNALEKANHKCELNPEHESFIRKSYPVKYMEPHHLIPLQFSHNFNFSLDVEQNVVCLCSNCHNKLHYGVNVLDDLKLLYEKRSKLLADKQIGLQDFDQLLKMYKPKL